MLVMTKELMDRAQAGQYAIAAPNITNSVEAEAAIAAAQATNAPLILDVLPEDMKIECPEPFIRWLRERCALAKTPLAINIDSGGTFCGAVQKVQYGATSLIANGANQPFEENVTRVKKIAELAHAAGITCEGELGGTPLTQPEQAAQFFNGTNVDWLAVAVGTRRVPGQAVEPYVDFDRLKAIKQAVGGRPLCLHGCAGVPPQQIEKACRMGINKVNLASDLRKAMAQAVAEAGAQEPVLRVAAQGYLRKLTEMIRLCGSEGKA